MSDERVERLRKTLTATWHDEVPADFPQAYNDRSEPAAPYPLEDLDSLRKELEQANEALNFTRRILSYVEERNELTPNEKAVLDRTRTVLTPHSTKGPEE